MDFNEDETIMTPKELVDIFQGLHEVSLIEIGGSLTKFVKEKSSDFF
jgi:hypothetical protein